MATPRRLEAIQRQIKIRRKDVKRAVEFGSLIADIFHDVEVNAGNSIKMKHRGLVDFNALEGATLNHQTIQEGVGSNRRGNKHGPYFNWMVTPPTAADTSAPTFGPLSCKITPLAFCS